MYYVIWPCRVARLNGLFPTVGDQHIVTNIKILSMITGMMYTYFCIFSFLKSSLCLMDSSGRVTLCAGSHVRIALPKSAVAGLMPVVGCDVAR